MTLINLTGHPLDFPHLGLVVPPADNVAKVTQRHDLVSMSSGIPVFDIAYVSITGLPAPQEDSLFVATTSWRSG